MKINKKEIEQYLNFLGHELFTVQVLLDGDRSPTALNTLHFKSKKYVQEIYPEAEHSKTSHAFTKKELLSSEVLKELVTAQKSGRAIWIMPNEGDGELALPSSPNCTGQQNVHQLNFCFIDTDDCPYRIVKEWMNEVGIKPHLIVETSPKKYHLYFRLNPELLTKQAALKWKAVQRALSHLGDPTNNGLGLDQSMHDYSKVLRLPGFFHLKNDPFPVTIKKENTHAPYSLEELFNLIAIRDFGSKNLLLAAHSPDISNYNGHQNGTYQLPKSQVTKGSRHAAITEFISSKSNFIQDKNDLLYATYGFITRKIEEPNLFLAGGKRNFEVKEAIRYYVAAREEEQKQSELETSKAALQIAEKNLKTDPFALPDSFYLNAPGIVGRIVKEITEKAMYPCPAFTFATVIAALGTLKAPSFTTQYGHAPVSYFLCLGPSGVGKAYAQDVMAATFTKLGIEKLLEQKVRSDRGIIRFLDRNAGTGMLMLDEGEGFLSSLYSEETPSYLKQCKELLLTLYTSNNAPSVGFGHIGNAKEEPTILHYPRLNCINFGVLHTLDKAFDKTSIKDGLLQRFLVVTHFQERKPNENYKPAKHLSKELLSELKEIVNIGRLNHEKDLLEVGDLEAEIAAEEDNERRSELEARLAKFMQERFHRPKTRIEFEQAARARWLQFRDEMDSLYNLEVSKQSGLEGLYTRAAEQVGRLSATLCEGKWVGSDIVEYCIQFVQSRVEALKEYCAANMDRGELGKELEELSEFLSKHGGYSVPVSYRDIVRGFKIRDADKLRKLLIMAEEAGEIRRVDHCRNGKVGRKGIGFRLTATND